MKSSLYTSSVIAALGITLLLISPISVSAQTSPKDVPKTKPSPQKNEFQPQPTTIPLIAYSGDITTMSKVSSRKKKELGQPQDTVTELKSFSLWSVFAIAWNDNRVKQETAVRQYLQTKQGLYDVSVKLAEAVVFPKVGTPGRAMYMIVDPAKQTLQVRYFVPGNTMFGRLSLSLAFDPDVSGKFEMEVVMNFDTKGTAKNPFVLKSTTVYVHNFVHPVLNISIAGQATAFGKASFADAGTAKSATMNLNGMMGALIAKSGFGVVTPGERLSNSTWGLEFELTKAPLVFSSK